MNAAWLREGEVHLWLASLELEPEAATAAGSLLDEAEQARARRFGFERDRRRFTAARAILRFLLARYLTAHSADPHLYAPQDVALDYGPRGKPHLREPLQAESGLRFNLAHSHEVAVYAFALHREVGVDVEQARPLPDLDAIARNFFSAGERDALDALPADEARTAAFYSCWTRKEAFVKLLGDGLSYPLDRFRVSLAPGDDSLLEWVDGVEDARALWTVQSFEVAPGYAAALATERPLSALSIFRFDTSWLNVT